MAERSCVTTKRNQIYTLEMFVNYVSLYAERMVKQEPFEFGVDIKFIDLPLIRIFQADFELTKKEKKGEITSEVKADVKYRTIHFNCGEMHIFVRNPNELIEMMRLQPLKLEAYRIKGISLCPYEILKDSLGQTEIPLYGCLCDQMMMATNDAYHWPKSYLIKNKFILVDSTLKPTGVISLFMRLAGSKRCIIGEFAIDNTILFFKNEGSLDEFRCTKVAIKDEDAIRAAEREKKICFPDEKVEESELDQPPKAEKVVGLLPLCKELIARNQHYYNKILITKKKQTKQIASTEANENNIIEDSKNYDHLFSISFGDDPPLKLYTGLRSCKTVCCTGGFCLDSNL